MSIKEDMTQLQNWSIGKVHVMEARRPGLILVDKKAKSCIIIDVAIPGDLGYVRKKSKRLKNIRI